MERDQIPIHYLLNKLNANTDKMNIFEFDRILAKVWKSEAELFAIYHNFSNILGQCCILPYLFVTIPLKLCSIGYEFTKNHAVNDKLLI